MADTRPVPVRPAAVVVLARSVGKDSRYLWCVDTCRASLSPTRLSFPADRSRKPTLPPNGRLGSAPVPGTGPTELGTGFRVAALRECFEEAGVLLARRSHSPLPPVSASEAEKQRLAGYRDDLNSRQTIPYSDRREGRAGTVNRRAAPLGSLDYAGGPSPEG